MGLYNGNLGNYYATPSLETLGAYQFISITDVINNFRVAYVGEDKIISKISRADIKFHALRGLQELTYDTFRSCKTLELEVPNKLILPLPHDYVNYVKISWIDSSGKCHTIRECKACPKDPLSYKQNDRGEIMTSTDGHVVTDTILISEGYYQDTDEIDWSKRRTEEMIANDEYWYVQEWVPPVYQDVYLQSPPVTEDSTTWNNLSGGGTGVTTDNNQVDEDQVNIGARYGLDPQHANTNGCFWINCRTGQIYFDSDLAGKTVTIQYISDTAATDDEMLVHKFAEEAMYRHIAWAILNTRSSADPTVVANYKKERFAAIRNAKLRLSNIKLEEITQILRGKSKQIKH